MMTVSENQQSVTWHTAVNWKLPAAPCCIPVNVLAVGKQCVLCAVPLSWPIISLLPAGADLHMGRRTRTSLCVPLWKDAQCVLDLGEGCHASARLAHVIFPLCAQECNLHLGEEASSKVKYTTSNAKRKEKWNFFEHSLLIYILIGGIRHILWGVSCSWIRMLKSCWSKDEEGFSTLRQCCPIVQKSMDNLSKDLFCCHCLYLLLP